MSHYAIILILLAGSATSCSPPKPVIEQLPPQSQRMPMEGFSISIPNDHGWIVAGGYPSSPRGEEWQWSAQANLYEISFQ